MIISLKKVFYRFLVFLEEYVGVLCSLSLKGMVSLLEKVFIIIGLIFMKLMYGLI